MNRLLTKDTIISFDIETTGLVAGVHSMIEIGAVAYRNGKEISCFNGALLEWEGSIRSNGTMQFWLKHRAQWDRIRKESRDPGEVMKEFYDWVIELPQPRVLAANPAPFDCAFLFWYLYTYCGEDAVNDLFKRHRAIDIRTYIAAIMVKPFSDAERYYLPKEWSEGFQITHNAIDDAREQGAVLMNLLKVTVELETAVNGETTE